MGSNSISLIKNTHELWFEVRAGVADVAGLIKADVGHDGKTDDGVRVNDIGVDRA